MLPRAGLTPASFTRGWDFFQDYFGPPILVDAGTMNKRSLAQDSVMTLHQLRTSEMTEGYDARIFSVSADRKAGVMEALRSLGISSDRIFVDIGVVAREFSDELVQTAALEAFGKPAN
jgi:hypothetical protein